jgi:heme-degrading monooxygenase HmoA
VRVVEEAGVVVELAVISVTPGREAEFEAAFPRAHAVISQAEGFRWAELTRSVERPSVFVLHVGWDSLAAHVEGFRGGPLFGPWREVVGPFFAEPPVVEHVTAVTGGIGPASG